MQHKIILLACLFYSGSQALEFEKQFENERVCVSYVKIMAQEEIDEHYDVLPQIVVALNGGVLTRLEADGSTTDVDFPTGKSVFRPAETPDKIHKTVNNGIEPIELIIMQLK